MIANVIRRIALAALVACAPVTAGCYAEVQSRPVAVEGYQPVFHDNGCVVYYDTAGEPYYYEGGRVVYVARTSPRYAYYVGHYRTYRPYYGRWYAHYGYRYRTYRYR